VTGDQKLLLLVNARKKRDASRVEQVIDNMMAERFAGAGTPDEKVAAANAVLRELALGAAAVCDVIADHTHGGVGVPGMLRHHLLALASALSVHAADRQEMEQVLGAGAIRAAAEQLTECADALQEQQETLVRLIAAARETL
jgi:hypothetical protein